MSKVILFSKNAVKVEQDRPALDRQVRGEPLRSTWNHFSSARGDMSAGVWHSEPGSWKVYFHPYEDEFFYVVRGRCRIIGNDGSCTEAAAGDSVMIPAGFSGVFEVVEAVTKHYVIVDRLAAG